MSAAQLRAVATAAPGQMSSREIIDAPMISPGFGSLQSFELLQRTARVLSSSTLVPAQYRAVIEKTNRYGEVTETRENPSALPNAIVALNMAQRMGADPLMVMQNLYIVEGRPSWSSQWIIAAINGCGRFSPLRFEITDLGDKTVECLTFVWEEGPNGKRNRVERKVPYKIRDKKCVAWAIEKETGARIESPSVTVEMAVREGWYGKNGSKWQTMDEVMLRYRTASFFGKLYAPELLMGLVTVEESEDMVTLEPQADGVYAPEPQGKSRAARDLAAAASVGAAVQSVKDARAAAPREPATLHEQWAKYDEVLATYGEKEAENFMPSEPRPDDDNFLTGTNEPTLEGESDPEPGNDGKWQPSPEEQAAIAAREKAEAQQQAQPSQPPAGRRARTPLASLD